VPRTHLRQQIVRLPQKPPASVLRVRREPPADKMNIYLGWFNRMTRNVYGVKAFCAYLP
jgi:hypothetical protein